MERMIEGKPVPSNPISGAKYPNELYMGKSPMYLYLPSRIS